MNILFLTLIKLDTLETRGIYQDLMNEFAAHGHQVYIISPLERREGKKTELKIEKNVHFLNVKILNIQKTNIIEKGLATLSIEYFYKKALLKFFKNIKFDLVLYATPPITFGSLIKFIKKRDGAKSYLLLKDIFPQNAVDLKMMRKDGFLYQYFRRKEKKLYEISDFIGCMSPANTKYLLEHNREISARKVEVNPNAIKPLPPNKISDLEKQNIRKLYHISINRTVFIYGGNLGKPQGLDFLLETILASQNSLEAFFVIVGSGTEFPRLKNWFSQKQPTNAILLEGLQKTEYDILLSACDVGLIFLDQHFTIPNFPSRLLSYLEQNMPVLVASDSKTDMGALVEAHSCGRAVIAGDIGEMLSALQYFISLEKNEFKVLGGHGRKYLEEEFLAIDSYKKIIEKFI